MMNIRKIQIVEHSTRQLVRTHKHQCHQRFKKKKKKGKGGDYSKLKETKKDITTKRVMETLIRSWIAKKNS